MQACCWREALRGYWGGAEMIIVGKLIVLACLLFNGFCLIGMLKMGSDDFMVWLGEKIVNAWRWLASHRSS